MTPDLRFALFMSCGERCVWCGRSLNYNDMEIDHVIPKHLRGQALRTVLSSHGLPTDWDLMALANCVSSCRRCNAGKGAKPLPNTPIIAKALDEARLRAAEIQRMAADFRRGKQLTKALATITGLRPEGGWTREEYAQIEAAVEALAANLPRTGVGSEEVHVYPGVKLVAAAERWKVVRELSAHTTVVSDGRFTGVTGTDISFLCPFCGSHGPWDGIICRTCGQRSEPD